ncbi:T9SS C-terminal target domain-containing protein [Dysgonomonas sp. 216]|uniref:glycosyl hydrolase n=1 Tax=Dysgonomonas sp. 216 TaxID=2302934 RepID=UPI0013D4F295|nr:glycosyl hydrolase [Dysgonomonas sp. 216]NDW18952.1 T9SS C-terminal target domain-containing protein [Dysgonomonas sp. 216]
MKNYYILVAFFVLFCGTLKANEVTITGKQTAASYSETTVTISDNSELHLTSATPLTNNSKVYLETENSWIYFEALRPSQVVASYLSYIYVGTQQAVLNTNVRVEMYLNGAVVIPHSKDFQPLEVFDEKNFGGNSQKYNILTFYKGLGDMNKSIRSFKLRKGYMATFATNTDGTGYSQVFIADEEDLELSEMPDLLDQSVMFIRTFKWKWPTKKGWNGSNAEQLNTIQATWYYNWDAAGNTSYLDAEYIPMRHNANWAGWETINSRENSTHVLGFNEPNQDVAGGGSNMTVDQCVSLWPNLMKSGLRIGSIAPTDGGLNYLYEFVDKCDALNYRIDFIAVHFYRGGQTPQNFYNFLKGIHDRTGRPIWITEWNNGANWTSESWPSSASEQQAKQKSDMTAFFNMLDTVSFVERHAVYNWVEWKRYMIDTDKNNTTLTPAGEMMKNFKAVKAYNPNKVFTPLPWKYVAPNVTSALLSSDQSTYTINVGSNENGGLASAILVEKKEEGGEFAVIDSIVNLTQTKFEFAVDQTKEGKTSYRLRYKGKGKDYSDYSIECSYILTPDEDIQLGKYSTSTLDWTTLSFGKQFVRINPVAILGTPTFANNTAMVNRIKNLNSRKLDLRFEPWAYTNASSISKEESLSYLLLAPGKYDFGGLKAEAGNTTAKGEWVTINFSETFSSKPAVFVSVTSNRSATATTARIKNVTTTGFDLIVKKEAAQTYTTSTEDISYFAIEQGTGTINGQPITVGMTAENEVGYTFTSSQLAKVTWDSSVYTDPLFFAYVQTSNDERGSYLRARKLTETDAQFFRQYEQSNTFSPSKETAVWMVINKQKSGGSSINPNETGSNNLTIYPNPASEIIYFSNLSGSNLNVTISDMLGRELININTTDNNVNIQDIPTGYYIINIDGKSSNFIKK